MYGKWVTLNFGECYEVRVYVSCTPTTSKSELQERALLALYGKMQEAMLPLAAAEARRDG